ncbi:MAG: DUF4136 domain-containing protein [Terracidiphilus sp.]
MLKAFHKLALAVGLVLVGMTASAAAQDVKINTMPGVDFSAFHTYKWVRVPDAKYPNQIADAEITDAVDKQLASKGLTKSTGEEADLYIDYQVSVQQEAQWNAYGTGGGYRWGGGMVTAQQTTINIGTLVLDMYNPHTKQLVWSGRATKTIDPGNNQEKMRKNLDKAMAKLLKNFPPGAAQK